MIEGQSWRDVTAPDSLRDRVLIGRHGGVRTRWMVGVGGIALSSVTLALLAMSLPQRSFAAVSLDRLVAAQRKSGVMFHLVSYSITPRGRAQKIWSGYVKGSRWRYVQNDFEQAFDGAHTLTFAHGPGG